MQGTSLGSLSNFYTGLYLPIKFHSPVSGQQLDALSAIARHLRTLQPRSGVIRLYPLDVDSGFFHDIASALTAAGYRSGRYFCFGNWTLPCKDLSFYTYFAARPSRVRNTVNRARKRLSGHGIWETTIFTTPGAGLEQAISAFDTIYRLSWKPDEAYPEFIRQLCQVAAEQGWLRLGILRLNGDAIAAQLWLLDNGTAYIFKLAYDPAAAKFSPGSVLTAAMIEHALDRDKVHEIDYLSGDDAYKQDWMSERRERYGLVAFDLATLSGMLGALRHAGGRLWRKLRPVA